MLNKALRIGQLITDAHPSDVRLLFKAYGITTEPTGKTIIDAYLVYGKPFLMQLIDIGYKSVSPFSGIIDGLEVDKLTANSAALTAKAQADALKAKGDTTNAIFGYFDKTATILQSAGGLFASISSIFTGKSVATGTNDPNGAVSAEYAQALLAAQSAESSNSTKTYLLVGAGLLVAVLVGIMFLKRK